jgi:hypothetical protein
MPSGNQAPHAPPAATAAGTRLVIGLVLLGIAAAATGIWYQRGQTRRCLAFYGTAAARRITAAPRVELWQLAATDAPDRLRAVQRREITAAKGLVHLRRGLVEDANFAWSPENDEAPSVRLPAGAWDLAFVFSDPAAGPGATTTLVVDFDERGGHVAIVGRPGRVGLGRIEAGLKKWIESL